ncbi:MAG TPA: hypothetical protein VJ801_18910, partial [Polyangia bacterium]|nr:hypothetical protein [Polyangia bacterium]
MPRLGIAVRWLDVVVLLAGCNGLTNAPPASRDGGRDSVVRDGTGPAETGREPDGPGSNQKDSDSTVAVDAQVDRGFAEVAADAPGPVAGLDAPGPGLDAPGPVPGLDAPGPVPGLDAAGPVPGLD